MKRLLTLLVFAVFALGTNAQSIADEDAVRATISQFYVAFNSHDFASIVNYTTEDWVHIAPVGFVRRGRPVVLQALEQAHSSFLKGVTDTPETIEVRFATSDVAVVTVPSRISTFTSPDGVRHENEGRIRTFIVVKRLDRWLIMQDQNTVRPLQP